MTTHKYIPLSTWVRLTGTEHYGRTFGQDIVNGVEVTHVRWDDGCVTYVPTTRLEVI